MLRDSPPQTWLMDSEMAMVLHSDGSHAATPTINPPVSQSKAPAA